MNKRRKIFQRAAALLCCMILLPSLFVFSVSAESDDGFFDVLQFGTANGSGTQVVTGPMPLHVVYQTTPEPFFYIDVVLVSPSVIWLDYNGTHLNRSLISYTGGAYRWRFWGNLVGDPSGYLQLVINVPGSEGTEVSAIFEQLRVSSSTTQMQYKGTVGTVLANPYQYYPSESMPDANTPATITLRSRDTDLCIDYFADITLTDWKNYDYLDVSITVRAASIGSINVSIGDLSLPFDLSYLSSGFLPDASWSPSEQLPMDQVFNCSMRIDLTQLHRDLSDNPVIHIDGLYAEYNVAQGITLNSVIGITIGSVPSELSTFWQRLQGLLVALFGSDPAAGEANQAQKEYHNESQEIVIEAVADWEAEIGTAEEGFDLGITFGTPALMKLSTLASKIYNNLGFFRSVYLIAGLMSVIMLLLSKSGIAAKLGNPGGSPPRITIINRYGSGGGGKRA